MKTKPSKQITTAPRRRSSANCSTRITKLLQAKSLRESIRKLNEATPEQVEAIERILNERDDQFRKWGKQNHDMMTWLAILHEETGEMAEACLHEKFGGSEQNNVFREAVQTAAVACQIVEYLLIKRDASFAIAALKKTREVDALELHKPMTV